MTAVLDVSSVDGLFRNVSTHVLLDRDRKAPLVVYSNDSPCKGAEIRTEAIVTSDGVAGAVARLGFRYLVEDRAERFLASTSWDPLPVRLESGELGHWHYPDY